MTDETDELIGSTLADRYWIISRLGVGGMGVVYRAWDGQQGLPVVVKIPKRSFLTDPDFAERFQREIRLLRGMSHPHIVPILNIGEHAGLPYVVMRFLPGGSLSNRRLRDDTGKPRPNPPEMLHLWLPGIADALDHVHSQGVVHRDVKPANVFFDAFWAASLGDFGIAKILADSDVFDREETLTGTNIGIGTQEYMSPEQFTPKVKLDGRVDQYALAVMVYEMVSGSRPFRGESAHVVVEILTHPAPSLAELRQGLPPTLVSAVHRGLSKNARERFATCREFASAVLAAVPRMADEAGVARLLCPGCSRILKLPVHAAGQKGSCPKCKGRMMVAADLGALWLLEEERYGGGQAGDDAGQARNMVPVETDPLSSFRPLSDTNRLPSSRRPNSSRRRRSRGGLWVFVVIGAMVFAAAIGAVMTLRPERRAVRSNEQSVAPLLQAGQLFERKLVVDAQPSVLPDPGTDRQSAEVSPDKTLVNSTESGLDDLDSRADVIPPVPPELDRPPPIPSEPEVVTDVINSVGMRFKLVHPGELQMGDPDPKSKVRTEEPHKVTLTRPYFIGVHEVTNGQWLKVNGKIPSKFQGRQNPVENVTWADASQFCEKLSQLQDEREAGRVYRLPTSAEWEYACRAGTATRYSFGDEDRQLADHAWFFDNADGTTHPVGRKKPNPWGLFDIYGNVWEWCSDWRGPYDAAAKSDPKGPASSELNQRVLRGGCWETQPAKTPFHSAARLGMFPGKATHGIGLRVVFDLQGMNSQVAASDGGTRRPAPVPAAMADVSEPAVPTQPDRGAGAPVESPVDLALKWIADHQLPDGGWSFDLTTCRGCAGKCSRSGLSKGTDRCGATAMALLPFLGRGYTHREGPYRRQIGEGIRFLVGMVREGQGKAYGDGGSLYSQGFAAIVLSECLAISGDDQLRVSAQAAINFISQAQDPAGGGWRYSPRQPGDTSSFGWQLTALHSGHLVGLKVDPLVVRKAVSFLDSVQVDDGAGYGYTSPGDRPSTSAVGLLCRTYLGWNKDRPALQRGIAKLAGIGPTQDLYYDYYATRLMHQVGGDEWIFWSNRMKPLLVESQSTNMHEAGSWCDNVDGGHGATAAGRLYCTSLATMILEVGDGRLPIDKSQADQSPDEAIPQPGR